MAHKRAYFPKGWKNNFMELPGNYLNTQDTFSREFTTARDAPPIYIIPLKYYNPWGLQFWRFMLHEHGTEFMYHIYGGKIEYLNNISSEKARHQIQRFVKEIIKIHVRENTHVALN